MLGRVVVAVALLAGVAAPASAGAFTFHEWYVGAEVQDLTATPTGVYVAAGPTIEEVGATGVHYGSFDPPGSGNDVTHIAAQSWRGWFIDAGTGKVGLVHTASGATEPYDLGGRTATAVAVASDHFGWVALETGDLLRIDPDDLPQSAVETFAITGYASPQPSALAAGLDGDVWFLDATNRKVGRVTKTGGVTVQDIPDDTLLFGPLGPLHDIAVGPSGEPRVTAEGTGDGGYLIRYGQGWTAVTAMGHDPVPRDLAVDDADVAWFTHVGTDTLSQFKDMNSGVPSWAPPRLDATVTPLRTPVPAHGAVFYLRGPFVGRFAQEIGPAGTAGADGDDGTAGQDGDDGETGAPGRDGSAGVPGPSGSPGAAGVQGPAGPAGPAGTVPRITCVTRGSRSRPRVTCTVARGSGTRASVRIRLVQGAKVFAAGGRVATARSTRVALHPTRRLRPGLYTVVVDLDGTTRIRLPLKLAR
jgi:streptogramin lyase